MLAAHAARRRFFQTEFAAHLLPCVLNISVPSCESRDCPVARDYIRTQLGADGEV
jgi:hypothetical protein